MKKLYLFIFSFIILLLNQVYAQNTPGMNDKYPIDAGIIRNGSPDNPILVYSDTKYNYDYYYNDFGQPSYDIYYKFTILEDYQVNVNHCQSYFDTYIHLLNSKGVLVASNDDNGPGGCPGTKASITLELPAGTYFVVSEGSGTLQGNITTQISVSSIPTIQEESDYILGPLDKSFVTTGILYDRVFPLANLENYQGLTTDDTTSSEHFTQAYHEFYNSSYNKSGYKNTDEFENYLIANDVNNTHAFGVMAFKYNYLDSNAVDKNLIYVLNNRLYDTPNRVTSPYIEATAIIASPLFPSDYKVPQGDHVFRFDPQTIITNTPFPISTIDIDFGDGYGSQRLYSNGTSSTTVARFRIFKKYVINVIITLNDGRQFFSKSIVITKYVAPGTAITACNGGDVVDITGDSFDASAYGMGVGAAQGKGYIFYSTANCATRRITKPIVFLDGFDPVPNYSENSRNVAEIWDEGINKAIDIPTGGSIRLGQKLRDEGYDIIIFDFKDGGDLIEKNALAVIKLLQTIYSQHAGTIQKDFSIIGPSMGALIGQYALAYAEKNNINVHAGLFISFDGPHQGANASIGLQQTMDYFFQKGILSKKSSRKNGYHRVSSARQMLVHHSAVYGESPTPDNFRNIFLSNLAAVGKYANPTNDPAKMRKVAIINGSRNLTPNQYVQPNSELFYLQIKRQGLKRFIDGRMGDRVRLIVNATPTSGRSSTSDIWLYKPIVNLLLWRPFRVINYAQPAPNNFAYDSSIGSFFPDPIKGKTESKLNNYLDIVGGLSKSHTLRHNINVTFMPTTSTIDLQVPDFTLAYDFSAENIVCTRKTPFDRVYAPNSNQEHVQGTPQNITWFESELRYGDSNAPTRVEQEDGTFVISGESTICGTSNFFVNAPSGYSVTWSTSGNLSIPGSRTGTSVAVSSTSPGTGILTANLISANGICRSSVSKSITIGINGALFNGAWSGGGMSGSMNFAQGSNTTAYVKRGNRYTIRVSPSVSTMPPITYSWLLGGGSGYSNVSFSGNSASGTLSSTGTPTIAFRLTISCPGCGSIERSAVFVGTIPNSPYYQSFSAYPNPSSTSLTISKLDSTGQEVTNKEDKKPFKYKIFNNQGLVIKEGKSDSGDPIQVPVDNIPNDTYFLHLFKDEEVEKQQIIIKH